MAAMLIRMIATANVLLQWLPTNIKYLFQIAVK